MGKWAQAFDPADTVSMKFFTGTFNEIETDFMVIPKGKFRYKKMKMAGLDVQVMEMPYAEDQLSMLILLPSKTLGFVRLMKSQSFVYQLETLMQSIGAQLVKRDMKVMMPKFRLETNHSLIPALSNMGIRKIFQAGVGELQGINGNNNLIVTNLMHKAIIDVSEDGTTADVTSGNIETRDALDEATPIEFRVDHPFMFVIRDRITGMIFAMGKVENV
jgi:serpin B